VFRKLWASSGEKERGRNTWAKALGGGNEKEKKKRGKRKKELVPRKRGGLKAVLLERTDARPGDNGERTGEERGEGKRGLNENSSRKAIWCSSRKGRSEEGGRNQEKRFWGDKKSGKKEGNRTETRGEWRGRTLVESVAS